MVTLKLNLNPTITSDSQNSIKELKFALKQHYKDTIIKTINSKFSKYNNDIIDVVCGFDVINFLFDDLNINVSKTDKYQPPKRVMQYLFKDYYCDEILDNEVIIGTNKEINTYLIRKKRKKKLNKIFS
jgi:hypothetical protein